MEQHLKQLIQESINSLVEQQLININTTSNIKIEHTRNPQFGDFACNIALSLAKQTQKSPRQLAELIIKNLPIDQKINKVEIAGPGFINFYLNDDALHATISDILNTGEDYGRSQYGQNQLINFEFVSANPTGPLHIGHGRGAAYGATCANLLEAIGFKVHREYYVNDGGRQMDILTVSVWLRYLEACGETVDFPQNCYKGDYIKNFAQAIKNTHQRAWVCTTKEFSNKLPNNAEDDAEQHLDNLIIQCKTIIGKEAFATIHQYALNNILDDIKEDLAELGLNFQEWYSEQSLLDNGALERCIEKLKQAQHTYTKADNLWFKATDFGDDKDRVLLRKNGKPTYFAADIAYHLNKFERHAEQIIDVWGADHHGYVTRITAALQALGIKEQKINILLVQFATLYRGKQKISMSTRSGSYITLRKLREEIGTDAVRFFYILRKSDQHLDFDLELAKSKTNDNPVYYIQYAHARICRVMEQLKEKNLSWDQTQGLNNLHHLHEQQETNLINKLSRYSNLVHKAATLYEPHLLAHYLKELAINFHSYYNAHTFLVTMPELRNARLCLIIATQQILQNGLQLLGINAPNTM